LIDVVPTIIDVAGATYPETYGGNEIVPLDGLSLRPAFGGDNLDRGEPIFIEHENNAFVRDGDWKLVGRGVSPAGGLKKENWELYNLAEDRTELNDLAATHPEKLEAMSKQWEEWATHASVFPKTKAAPAGGGKGKKKTGKAAGK
jgi:arylsulfatase A-like enzyme